MRHSARGSQRLPHAGKRLSSCRLTKQRLINALAAEIDESAAFSEGTGLLYRTKFRRCYRKARPSCPNGWNPDGQRSSQQRHSISMAAHSHLSQEGTDTSCLGRETLSLCKGHLVVTLHTQSAKSQRF